MASSDKIAAFMRTTYLQVFRNALNVYVAQWNDAYRRDPTDQTFTARRALAHCHHTAWRDAGVLAKRKFGLAAVNGTGALEQECYLDALLTVAPPEWRAEFGGRPPSREDAWREY